MTNGIIPISQMEQAIQTANSPKQTKQIEVTAAAAQAWAKEQGDYELFVEASRVYLLARRKTTELIKPYIFHGNNGRGNDSVTSLADFGFTKMQWNRRVKELEVSADKLESYFDECISNHWEPSPYGLMRYMSAPHVSYNTGENEWYTPPEYIASANRVMGWIDLDPASSAKANKIVKAKKFYSRENSGLDNNNKWGGRVWMNPPYSLELIRPFTSRYVENVENGNISQGIVLVNNATETNWFKSLIGVSSAIAFPTGRVRFLDPDGNPGDPLQGQAVIYTGKQIDKFRREFEKFGWSARL